MSVTYRGVGWNRQKKLYDAVLAVGIVGGVAAFGAATFLVSPNATPEAILIRGTAAVALILLHVVLAIGPLARLDRRFAPLLYNRRHLGVAMFFLALIHGALCVLMYHAMGSSNPVVSIFTAYQKDYDPFLNQTANISNFPFEPFGLLALAIFFLMAATSHDFWLRNLGASFWKTTHLLVHVAYGAVVAHVILGVAQSEPSLILPALLGVGFVAIILLHLIAWRKEAAVDRRKAALAADGFADACDASELREGRGAVVVANGERLAVYLHQGRVFALSNVCRHQGGPLGEGKIVDGCVTCPWHGWNYRVEDGVSPPPFREIVPTHDVRVEGGRVFVQPRANALQTRCEGAAVQR